MVDSIYQTPKNADFHNSQLREMFITICDFRKPLFCSGVTPQQPFYFSSLLQTHIFFLIRRATYIRRKRPTSIAQVTQEYLGLFVACQYCLLGESPGFQYTLFMGGGPAIDNVVVKNHDHFDIWQLSQMHGVQNQIPYCEDVHFLGVLVCHEIAFFNYSKPCGNGWLDGSFTNSAAIFVNVPIPDALALFNQTT